MRSEAPLGLTLPALLPIAGSPTTVGPYPTDFAVGATAPTCPVIGPYQAGRRCAAKLNILVLPCKQRSRSQSAIISSSASPLASATIWPSGSTMQEPPIRPAPSSLPALATATAQVAFM